MDTSPTVTVIGGGFAGLSAALMLHDAGVAVVVAEARDRVGGRVWSVRLANGAVAELGGEWIFSGSDVLEELCARFDLSLLPTGTDFALRERPGTGATGPDQDAFLRAATEALERLGAGDLRTRTVGDFLSSVPGSDAARATVRARLQGTFAADLGDVALRAAIADHAFRPGGAGPSFRIDGGNDALARGIAHALPDVRLRTLVDSIHRDDSGVEAIAGSRRIRAHAAVVALPAPIAARLRFEPELPREVLEALGRLPVGVAAKLVVATRRAPELQAVQSAEPPFWCWTALGEGGGTRKCLTSFAGSTVAQEQLRTDRLDGGRWMGKLRELAPEVEPDGEPLVYAWASDRFAMGAYAAWDNPSFDRAEVVRRPVERVAFAGEHTAPEGFHGTMEGALRSGRRAAAQVLDMLGLTGRPGK
jgi:monoamine oxidase